ncbi:MAG: isopeptide-forming domain-containing fimbrial protein [Bilifractor sp.]|jgi:fimbrial isopeptide formation D2 family protein/LPXTG-motif cell wall-anchored protein
MKKMKKLISTVCATAMVIGMTVVPAAADTGDTISVTGLGEGDTASYFQILNWSETDGWQLDDAMANSGLTADNLTDGINASEAATIATAYQSADADGSLTISGTTGTSPVDMAKGLYYVRVIPGTAGVIYNPIFVGNDFDDASANSVDASTAVYEGTAVAKKQETGLEKTAGSEEDAQKDVAVGDTVLFTIDTTMPAYTGGYTSKTFTITDTLSTGLTLNADSIQVTNSTDGSTYTAVDAADYTVTTTDSGFEVSFRESYFTKRVNLSTPIRIQYSATVTSEAQYNYNEMDNTATLTYTNNPGGDENTVTDKTRHYTFSIGATLLGNGTTEKVTHEAVKVVAGSDLALQYETGSTVTTYHSTTSTTDTYSGLAEAGFTLYKTRNTDGTYADPTGDEFTTTDTGNITFQGLDAGTYYLVETTVPNGYTKAADHTIVITPTYDLSVEAGGDGDDETLDTYTVTVDGLSAVTYNITNEVNDDGSETSWSEVTDGSTSAGIANNEGANLPTTGGIGTRIFYAVGGILVLAAVVLLVSRRRMGKA